MNRTLLAAALSAAALTAGLVAAPLAQAQTAPPTLEQLCAAVDVKQVDVLLAGLAPTDDLVGDLAPLGEVTVPGAGDKLVVAAGVTLDDLRARLGCLPVDLPETTDPTPTDTTAPTTTTAPTSTTATSSSSSSPTTTVDPIGDDGSTATTGGDQVSVVPEGSANTGQA